MYDPEMETVGDWQLFGGQLQDLPAQSTFADLRGQVLQNSFHDDIDDELYQRSRTDLLEDSAWQYPVDGIDAKGPSSLKVQESSSVYEDDLYDLLSSSPEEAFLPVDDDSSVVNVTSAVDNSYNFVVTSCGGGSGLGQAKFNYGNMGYGQQCLISNVPQNLHSNQIVKVQKSHDLVGEAVRTDSFVQERSIDLDSLYYENHYKSAAELDGIECANDSLFDEENVCKILQQLVDNHSGSSRPMLLSVSPEEVDSILSCNSSLEVIEDFDPALVPCSPPVSSSGFLPFSDVAVSSTSFLATEYSRDSLSVSSTSSHSPGSSSSSSSRSPCIPYSVESRPDRKQKKKEQNKTAALRYRNKKRELKGVVYSEVEELEQKNADLQARADDLSKEINYLKSLLDEIKRQ